MATLLSTLTMLAVARGADTRSVVVEIQGDDSTDFAAIRTAIEKELGAPAIARQGAGGAATRGVLEVCVDKIAKTLHVSFTDERGAVVSRSVGLPGDPASIASSSALLAGNLVRDQTSDLLSSLAPAEPAGTAAPSPTPAPSPPDPADKLGEAPKGQLFPVNLALFYPVATNKGKPDIHTYVDLGLFYTRVGSVSGAQASGFVATASGNVRGAQGAGFVGVAASLNGLQGAGFVAITSGNVRGAQVAGFTSIASGNVVGLQGSTVNFAHDVVGAQIGVVNMGRNVRGLQLGVVNVSDDVDGAAIGVASISKTGHISAVAWASATTYGNLGVKFATKHVYTILSGAYHREGTTEYAGYGFAIGAHIPVLSGFYIDADVSANDLWRTRDPAESTRKYLFKPRVLAGYELTPTFAVFGGGGLAVQVEDNFVSAPELRPDATIGFQVTP